MIATPQSVDVTKVREWLADSGEIAFVNVRQERQHGEGLPLLAVNLPYSRREAGSEFRHKCAVASCRSIFGSVRSLDAALVVFPVIRI